MLTKHSERMMDGKATALRTSMGPYAQHVEHESGRTYGLMRTVTTTLATARGKPCIDVNPIVAHTSRVARGDLTPGRSQNRT